MRWHELQAKLQDREWRLNNLYWVLNEDGEKVRFTLRPAQAQLIANIWYRNIILKARQLGFSTAIQILMLDTCLFNAHVAAGVIAHTREDAADMFENKIKFAFLNLPEPLRERMRGQSDSQRKLVFANGSSIKVGTSHRSGTLQMLHVSELGKLAKERPIRAKEVRTGAFETVPLEGIIFVESTAEGHDGEFYELVQTARQIDEMGGVVNSLDWRFHFFAWWQDPNKVTDPGTVAIYPHHKEYFKSIRERWGILLTPGQKAWYAAKQKILGDEMKREHPSHPDEAFEQSIEGAYFHSEFAWLRKHDHIGSVPAIKQQPVHTAWDLGISDSMAIWFFQVQAGSVRLLWYFEDHNEGWDYYAKVIREWADENGVQMGRHFAPHDIEVRQILGAAEKRRDTAAKHGIQFETVPRISNEAEGINASRQMLPQCYFDEEGTADGRKCLEAFRREWDNRLGRWKDRALHDWASHGYKAFETLARADIWNTTHPRARPVAKVSSKGWT